MIVPSDEIDVSDASAAAGQPRTPSKKIAGSGSGLSDGYAMRRLAVDFGISLITNVKCLELLSSALIKVKSVPTYSIEEYYSGAFERTYGGLNKVGERRRSPSSVSETDEMEM